MSFSDAIREINETHFLYSGALEKSLDWNEYITLHQSNFKRGNRQANEQMQLQKIHLNGSNVSFMSYSRKQIKNNTKRQWCNGAQTLQLSASVYSASSWQLTMPLY